MINHQCILVSKFNMWNISREILHSSIFCSAVHVLDLKVEDKTTVDLTVLQLTVEL